MATLVDALYSLRAEVQRSTPNGDPEIEIKIGDYTAGHAIAERLAELSYMSSGFILPETTELTFAGIKISWPALPETPVAYFARCHGITMAQVRELITLIERERLTDSPKR